VRVRVRVVVARVVLVVARGRNQAVEEGLQVGDPAGLVLHRRHGDRRADREDDRHAGLHPGARDDRADAVGQVRDRAVPGSAQPQQPAVDGHRS